MNFNIDKLLFDNGDRNMFIQEALRLVYLNNNPETDIQELYNCESKIINELESNIRLLRNKANKDKTKIKELFSIVTTISALRNAQSSIRLIRYKSMKIFNLTPKSFRSRLKESILNG